METRRIRLRQINENDYPVIFEWRNTEKFRYLFHHTENIIGYLNFCEEFSGDATVRKFQFLIEKTDNNEPIGLTFIHSYSEKEKHCLLNIYFTDSFERKGYGVDTFVLFFHFLLEEIGIKRIYVEAFAYNLFSISCIRRTGMTEVNNFGNKKLHDGKEYNILRFVGDRTILPKVLKYKEILSLKKY